MSGFTAKKINFIILSFVFIAVFQISNVESSNATIVYRSNTGSCASNALNCPKIREWNSTGTGSFGPEVELATAGSPIRNAMIKYSPISAKRAIVTQSDDGFLDAYTCSSDCGSANSWTVSNNIGQVWSIAPATHSRRFDITFESATGDLILVYGIMNTTTTCDLGYLILPSASSSFSGAPSCIDDSGHSTDLNYSWISADSNPSSTSEQIIAVGFDSNDNDINAFAWNGTAWISAIELSSAATATSGFEALASKYSADGAKGMTVGAHSTSGQINSSYWNGTKWLSGGIFDVDASDAVDVRWLTLKADPSTGDLQLTVIDSGSDLGTAYWNGATWAATSNIDTAVDSAALRVADFEWNQTGSIGYLVWDTDTTGTTLSNRTCAPQCTSTTSTFSAYAGTGAWITLFKNPTVSESVKILGARLQSTFDIGSFRWSHLFSNYSDTAITSDTTVTTFESYNLAFQLASSADDTTSPQWSAPSKNETQVYQNSIIQFNSSWTEDTELSSYIFSINQTGSWINSSPVTFSGASNTSANITTITASSGAIVEWKFYANDSSNNWNSTSVQSFTINVTYGYLNAELISPTGTNSQPQNQTFSLLANLSCIGPSFAVCGTVNGTIQYNSTTVLPSADIQGGNIYASPFYTVESNPQSCGAINATTSCILNWTINTTGAIGSGYKIHANFSSNATQVKANASNYTTINIISPSSLSITISDELANVQFGSSLNPGTQNNSAINNSQNAYSITCDYSVGNCNVSMKGNGDLYSGSNILGITNISWNQQNSLSGKTKLTSTYNVINSSLAHLATQLIYFWIDIPESQIAGSYVGNFTIQGLPN